LFYELSSQSEIFATLKRNIFPKIDHFHAAYFPKYISPIYDYPKIGARHSEAIVYRGENIHF
jgi:hypothetical protein